MSLPLSHPRIPGIILLLFTLNAELGIAQLQEVEKLPPALTEYYGRRIARTMHFSGAEWLTRDSREKEERCSLLLTNLGLKKGMTVCDLGCGNGYYALKIAQIVGAEGKVLAVDIQPEMLKFLNERAEEKNITNVETIQGTLIDPKLPAGKVDLILCVDVYHEFSHPEHMLRRMREALSEDGLLVLVEYRAEDPEVPIKPLHKMSKAQVEKELSANGFKLEKSFDELPWQHVLFYGRADKDQKE